MHLAFSLLALVIQRDDLSLRFVLESRSRLESSSYDFTFRQPLPHNSNVQQRAITTVRRSEYEIASKKSHWDEESVLVALAQKNVFEAETLHSRQRISSTTWLDHYNDLHIFLSSSLIRRPLSCLHRILV